MHPHDRDFPERALERLETMGGPRRYPLVSERELASGVRLGGKFVGPMPATQAIWVGRPPVLESGYIPQTLSIAATPPAATPGLTVMIGAEASNAFGGRIFRQFMVGGGLSADLRVGNFEHVRVRVLGPPAFDGVPDGMTVWFCWSFNNLCCSPLYSFLDYPVPGTVVPIPEGAEGMVASDAVQITFSLPSFGTTFVQGVKAGQEFPVIGGAFSANQATQFIFRMRGI